MWTHYLKMSIRTLLADRSFSFVNLLGLSIGLASVAFIFLFVKNEFSYDTWLPEHDTLFRIDTVQTTPGQTPLEIARAPGPLSGSLLKDFPQFEDITRGYITPTSVILNSQPFNEDVLVADANFFSVLGLPFAKGAADTALKNTTTVSLSARTAQKFFGRTDPVGQRLTILTPEPRDFVVSSVFETLPQNSHMQFDIVIPFDAYFKANGTEEQTIPDQWGGAYFHTYARLKSNASVSDIERELPAFIDRSMPQSLRDLLSTAPHEFFQFKLVPIREVHFSGASLAAMKPTSNRTTVLAVATVGVLILLIASINFANLTTARSTLRAREVALRKVVGADRKQIFVQFLSEAIFLTMIAGLLALCIVELMLPYVGALLGLENVYQLTENWELWIGLILLVLITAIGSGLYPSVVISRVRPAAVFNKVAEKVGGGLSRNLFVVLQFAISIALIVITIVMLLQTQYARDIDLGFSKENMLVVRIPEDPRQASLARSFEEALARNVNVINTTISSAVPSDISEDSISITRPNAVKPIQLGYHQVDNNFFKTFDVKPLAGRTTSMRREESVPANADDGTERSASAVINEAALSRLTATQPLDAIGLTMRSGETIYTVVGVVPNLHFRSLHEPVRAEMYVLNEDPGGVVSIRYRADNIDRFLAFVDRAWSSRIPDRAIDREFLDDALNALYEKEQTQVSLLSIFSGLAIVLSCLGLLAMAAFSVQRRTKEIAIRKVLGARSTNIMSLLLWQFSKPILLANLVAWPIAWLVLSYWLEQFAYRIDLPFLVFIFAGLIALLIGSTTIVAHTFRVSRVSPVESLRHE